MLMNCTYLVCALLVMCVSAAPKTSCLVRSRTVHSVAVYKLSSQRSSLTSTFILRKSFAKKGSHQLITSGFPGVFDAL